MKTTTVSSTTATVAGEHGNAMGPRAVASSTVRLIGTLAVNAAVLLAGVGLIGLAWRALWIVLLPLMVAVAGAGVRFAVLNRMAFAPTAPAVADSPSGSGPILATVAAKAVRS
jgi:hypothetical protein